MKAKCKDCGEVDWLLEKTENRSFYAVVNNKDLRWLERVKYKKVSPFTLICSKCEKPAGDWVDTNGDVKKGMADMEYTIKEKPLKVVWQSSFWDRDFTQPKPTDVV